MASEVKIDPKLMRVTIAFDLEDKESLQRMVNAISMVLLTTTLDGRGMKIEIYPGVKPPADPENLPPAASTPAAPLEPRPRKPKSPQPVAAKT
jgi:hypothetical protein